MTPLTLLSSLTVAVADLRATRGAGRAASTVAAEHEILVLPQMAGAEGEDVAAAAARAGHEWLLLASAGVTGADLQALVPATVGHDLVLGRCGPLRPPARARRLSHGYDVAPESPRRGGDVREPEFPLLLLRRELAARLGDVAGAMLPAPELAVLAVLLGEPVAIVRVAGPVRPSARRAPRAA